MTHTPERVVVCGDPLESQNYETLVCIANGKHWPETVFRAEHNWQEAEFGERRISWKEAQENAKRCALLWNAAHDLGISNEALEAGAVGKLVEAARGMLPTNMNMACNMADEAIIPLDVRFSELRALFQALALIGAKS